MTGATAHITRTARRRPKTGDAQLSTQAIASILGFLGESISTKTGVAAFRVRISTIPHPILQVIALPKNTRAAYAQSRVSHRGARLRACKAPHARRRGKLFPRSSTRIISPRS